MSNDTASQSGAATGRPRGRSKKATKRSPETLSAIAPASTTELPSTEPLSTSQVPATAAAPQSALPPGVEQVIALFEEQPALRFPGIDGDSLRSRAASVEQLSEQAVQLRVQLEALVNAQREASRGVAELAQRAFAYARVFAADDAELSARLEGFALAQAAKPANRKARRKRNKETQGSQLPLAESQPGSADDTSTSEAERPSRRVA